MREPQHRTPGAGRRAQGPVSAAEGISSLEIVVAVPPDKGGELLGRELSRMSSGVRRIWPLPPRLSGGVDVMFCELTAELLHSLPWIPGQPTAALVVVMDATQEAPHWEVLRNCTPHAVLHRPFTSVMVRTSLAIARAQFLYERRLRTRIDKLDETLRSFRCVERAKSILKEKRNLDEENAYHFMRRQAMNQRVSVGVIAAAIVDSHDILG
jgi:AmiR/NasT family two-component response regulator